MTSAAMWAIFGLTSLIATSGARAQQGTELRGRIVNDSGVAIVGASITLSGVRYTIRTDSSGLFVLSGTPGSTLVFSMRAPGYRGDTWQSRIHRIASFAGA